MLLRSLLGQPPEQDDPLMLETVEAMKRFIRICQTRSSSDTKEAVRYRIFAVRAVGLLRSLQELEGSLFAARHFAARLRHGRWDELTEAEKTDYDLHVYFDKNAYIRLFSLLDKFGTLLNDVLELHTEQVKPHYSYFTMLRVLRQSGRLPELAEQLAAIKERHRSAMNRLRTRRNMEIHYMNAELQDDLQHMLATDDENGGKLENLAANMADSADGWDMVRETLRHSFRFAAESLERPPTGGGSEF